MKNDFCEFIQKHGFLQMGGGYTGVYADMCLTLLEADEGLCALLYLDLPKKGARARKELFALMVEKAERYSISVSESDNPFIIKIDVKGEDDCISRLERYLIECDTSLRPYGREMGILCADCRCEIKDIAPVYVERDGFTLPICPDCESSKSAKTRADNRRVIAKRRARMGLLGALAGMAVTAAIWILLCWIQYPIFYLALGAGFVVDFFYRRFGGINDRFRTLLVAIFAVLGIMIGDAVGSVIDYNRLFMEIPNEYIGEYLSMPMYDNVYSYMLWYIKNDIISMIAAVIGAIIATRGIKRFR